MQEQNGYAYDAAGNLNFCTNNALVQTFAVNDVNPMRYLEAKEQMWFSGISGERTNNALIQSFSVNNVNELSSASQAGTLTVGGTAGEPNGNVASPGVTSVMVNGQSASVYEDGSFAATGFTPANGQNTYTAIAQDNVPQLSTNSVTVNVLGDRSYTYDANGNLTSDGLRNFAYDDENQLVAVWVANSWSNSFAYDGLMRKRIEQDFAWSGSQWTETNEVHYVYDVNLVLQERDKNNEPLTTYTRGVDLSGTLQGAGGIGGLLARSDNQKNVPAILTPQSPTPDNLATSYYFSDDQGNIIALVSPVGMILAQYEYDPFGNLISKSGLMADINKYRFSSKEWEGNSGLYYYGYRFYDPNLQRWVSRDPIQELGGLNLYAFVENDPLNAIDAFALDVWIEGPSGSEPTGHQSINVGDPNGDYSSYSFGADGGFNLSYGLEGSVYEDDELGGPIEAYKKTTPLEDRILKSQLDAMVGDKGAYGLGNTCRSWSQDQFKNAPGKKSSPPPRTPVPRTFWRKPSSSSKPSSTTTSSSGTSTSR